MWGEQLRSHIAVQVAKYRLMAKLIGLAFWREQCPYCGMPIDIILCTLDHVVPQCQGGSDELENLIPTCKLCNNKRGDEPLDEYLAHSGMSQTQAISFFERYEEWKQLLNDSKQEPRDFKVEMMRRIEAAGTFEDIYDRNRQGGRSDGSR